MEMVELYLFKSAAMKLAVDKATGTPIKIIADIVQKPVIDAFVQQFPEKTRSDADRMSEYYRLFYMLENDIRRLIDDTLTEVHGSEWWHKFSPTSVKEEYKLNQQREQEAGVTSRSDNPLEYVSFGQLGDIIRANWSIFGGILSNQKALGRVMFALNVLRGPIAHCGLLAEDEVDRLKLTVKDWFRILEGPK